MGAITSSQLIEFTDKIVAGFLLQKGASDANSTSVGISGCGSGDASVSVGSDWGASKSVRQLLDNVVIPWADADVLIALLPSVKDLQTRASWQYAGRFLYQPVLQALNMVAAQSGLSGVSNIDTFATYYNTGPGGPFNALLNPFFRELHYICLGNYPLPKNLYAPQITNMGQRTISGGTPGSFTAGSTVDTSKYAGVARIQAVVSGWSGSSGTLSVPVSGFDASGAPGMDWYTGTISGNGTVVLTPGSTVKVITSVDGVTFPGGMVNGTVVIGGIQPAGRSNPPS